MGLFDFLTLAFSGFMVRIPYVVDVVGRLGAWEA